MKGKADRSALGLIPQNLFPKLDAFKKKHINHLGRELPLHITLLPEFYLPREINDDIEQKLNELTKKYKKFTFYAKPLSCFPTNRVLYLTPSPIAPIENLVARLYKAFPKFEKNIEEMPTFHMTVAYEYEEAKQASIVKEYINNFGYEPIEITAGAIIIFYECDGEWKEYKRFNFE